MGIKKSKEMKPGKDDQKEACLPERTPERNW